jgi:predicted ferric reductase
MSDLSVEKGPENQTRLYTVWSLVAAVLFSVLFLKSHLIGPIEDVNFGQWKKALELLTGFWLLGAMAFTMLPALRLPDLESCIGGLPQGYVLHRRGAVLCSVLLALHWLVAKGPKWAVQLGLMSPGGRRPRAAADPETWELVYKFIQDMGEWVGYAIIFLLILGFFAKKLRQTNWVRLHRFFGPLLFLGAVHGVCSFPKSFIGTWPQYAAGFGVLFCIWLLSKQYLLDTASVKTGKIIAEQKLGGKDKLLTVETDEPLHIAVGQFICFSADAGEHPHPFTVTGFEEAEGKCRFTILVRNLGPYTARIVKEVQTGKTAYVQGPYGEFLSDLESEPLPHLWVAGGVGITPFLAAMTAPRRDTTLIWCCRAPDAELLQTVADAAKRSGVVLRVLDSAKGERLGDKVLLSYLMLNIRNAACRYCGPVSLGERVRAELAQIGNTNFKTENFRWR